MTYELLTSNTAVSTVGSDPCVLAATGSGGLPVMLLLGAAAVVVVLGWALIRGGRRRTVTTVLAGLLAVGLFGAGAIGQAAPAVAATGAPECVEQSAPEQPVTGEPGTPEPAPTRLIVANDDELGVFTTLAGGASTSVLANDTLDGAAATAGTVTVTGVSVPAGLVLNADGTVTVPVAQAPGDYEIGYRICETAAPTNCATATATLSVLRPITANPDDLGTLEYEFGGPWVTSTVSVLDNDLLDGVPVTLSTVTFSPDVAPTNTTWNSDGTFSVVGVAPPGPTILTYEICETAAPSNCATGTAMVILQTLWP